MRNMGGEGRANNSGFGQQCAGWKYTSGEIRRGKEQPKENRGHGIEIPQSSVW